jgi:hypothetical protein
VNGSEQDGPVRTLIAVLVAATLVIALVAVSSAWWAQRTVLDREVFVRTVTAPLDTPAVDRLLAQDITRRAMASVGDLGGQQPIVAGLLGLDATASRDDIETAVEAKVMQALDEPEIQAIRDAAVGRLHDAVLALVRGDSGSGAAAAALTIDLGPMADAVLERIDTNGRLAGFIRFQPTSFSYTVRSGVLQPVGSAINALSAALVALALIAIVLGLVLLLVVRAKPRAVAAIAICLVVAGGVGLLVVVASTGLVTGLVDPGPIRDAVGDAWSGLMNVYSTQSAALAAVGVGLLVVVVVAGLVRTIGRSRRVSPPPSSIPG